MNVRRTTMAILGVLSAACAYTVEEYEEDLRATSCDIAVFCGDGAYSSVDECLTEPGSADWVGSCKDYDPSAARDCIRDLTTIADTCPEDLTAPDICLAVCPSEQEPEG